MLEIVLIVLAGLLLGVVALAGVAVVRFRSLRARHRRHVASVDPRHSEPAGLVGVASEGSQQANRPGTLAVGDTHLVFVQLLPERQVLVPRDSITSARATRHFLGRTAGQDLLVVTWSTAGLEDAAAFAVPDVATWCELLA